MTGSGRSSEFPLKESSGAEQGNGAGKKKVQRSTARIRASKKRPRHSCLPATALRSHAGS